MNREKLQRLLESEADFDIKAAFAKAWEIYQSRALLHVSFMFLVLTVQAGFVLYLEQYVLLYSLLIAPPLYSGLYLVANKISQGLPVAYSDYFGGFRYLWLSFSIWLIAQVLIVFGLFALIAPGVYLAVGYFFAVLMGMFGGFDFWTSMELSRKLVTRNWWKFFVLVLILIGMNLATLITFGMALVITLPMTFFVNYVVFEELTKEVFATDSAGIPTADVPES
jgi:hypothetical protein